jgi:hypothetical protein
MVLRKYVLFAMAAANSSAGSWLESWRRFYSGFDLLPPAGYIRFMDDLEHPMTAEVLV